MLEGAWLPEVGKQLICLLSSCYPSLFDWHMSNAKVLLGTITQLKQEHRSFWGKHLHTRILF